MSPAKGHKIKDAPIEKITHFRANNETLEKLKYVSERMQKSKSEVIRNGINIQYEELKEKE